MTNSLMTSGSEFLEETNIGLPELHKDIAWTDPDTGLVWVPNTINNPDQGMVFADGTNKDEWSWAAVKSKKVEDRKEGDPEYKMDMSTKKNFKERDYMDALSFIGILPD